MTIGVVKIIHIGCIHFRSTTMRERVALACVLSLIITSSLFAASGDEYLDALSSEVEGMSVDPASEKQGEDVQSQQVIRNNQTGDSQTPIKRQEFESALYKDYPGTFSYYKQLAIDKRTRVFEAYSNNPNIKSVRQMVMEFIVGE